MTLRHIVQNPDTTPMWHPLLAVAIVAVIASVIGRKRQARKFRRSYSGNHWFVGNDYYATSATSIILRLRNERQALGMAY